MQWIVKSGEQCTVNCRLRILCHLHLVATAAVRVLYDELETNFSTEPMSKRKPRTQLTKLSNLIGDRGENIFELAITDYSAFSKPLFKPGFLGEKWPTIDYYVELLGGVKDESLFLRTSKINYKQVS